MHLRSIQIPRTTRAPGLLQRLLSEELSAAPSWPGKAGQRQNVFLLARILFLERARRRAVPSLASKAKTVRLERPKTRQSTGTCGTARCRDNSKFADLLSGLFPITFRHHYTMLCTDMLSSSIGSRIVILPSERTSAATFFTFSSVFQVPTVPRSKSTRLHF